MEKLLGTELYKKYLSAEFPTEIRIRDNKKILIKTLNGEINTGIIANQELIKNIINNAANFSLYAYEEELARGFLFYGKGVRVGVGGIGAFSNERFIGYKKFTSLCIRIPHEVKGCSKSLGFLYKDFQSTVIISPPACGKTTLIRDLARELAKTYDIFVIDERYELAGGDMSLNLGERSDIVQGVPKKICLENAIRSLSPQIIVCDEIFGDEEAAVKAAFSGAKILASVHGESFHDVKLRNKTLAGIFSCAVILTDKPKAGTIKSIIKLKQ